MYHIFLSIPLLMDIQVASTSCYVNSAVVNIGVHVIKSLTIILSRYIPRSVSADLW